MSNFSEINLANQILSLVIAGGLVAFIFLLLRLAMASIKLIGRKIKTTFPSSADVSQKNEPNEIQNK